MSPPRIGRGCDVLAVLSILAVAAVLCRVLFVNPAAGYADNGDYDRIMIPAGFLPATPGGINEHAKYVNFDYLVVAPRNSRMWYLSSERIVAIGVHGLAKPFLSNGRFDLRILGTAHAVLLLTGIGLMVSATRRLRPWQRLPAAVMIVLFFSDVAYIVVLNSFYGQVASFVFLLMAAGFAALALRDPARSLWPILYFASAVLFVTSKPQETPEVIPVLLLFLILVPRSPGPPWRRPEILLSAAAAGVAFAFLVSAGAGMRSGGTFKLVFDQILPQADHPARVLSDLGLPADDLRYSGVMHVGPRSPLNDAEFRERWSSQMSYARIAMFYLRNPGVVFRELIRGAPAALSMRDDRSGRFARASGLGEGARVEWPSYWSRARAAGRRHAAVYLAILLGGSFVTWWAAAARRMAAGREWKPAAAAALLATMAIASYSIVTLVSMQVDLRRKLLTFDLMADLLLIVDVVAALQFVPRRGRS